MDPLEIINEEKEVTLKAGLFLDTPQTTSNYVTLEILDFKEDGYAAFSLTPEQCERLAKYLSYAARKIQNS